MRYRSISAGAAVATIAATLAVGQPATAADGHDVRLRTLDRSGSAVPSVGHLVNVANHARYLVPAGGSAEVPAGTYAVTTYISDGDTTTLGVKVVKVAGDRTVAFDARDGRRVRFKITDRTEAFARALAIVPEIGGVPGARRSTELPSDRAFAIPMDSRHVTFTAHAVLEKPGVGLSPYRYDIVRRVAGGIPEALTFRADTDDLARVPVKVRTLDAGQDALLSLRPRTAASGRALVGDLRTPVRDLPRTVTSYRSPGYRWTTTLDLHGDTGDARLVKSDGVLRAGAHPAQTWGPAVWGPSAGIDVKVVGDRLVVDASKAICSSNWLGGGTGCAQAASSTLRVWSRNVPLATGTTGLEATIPADPRWYRLVLETKRPAGAKGSSEVTATWRFRAKGAPSGTVRPLFTVIRMEPEGLGGANKAAKGAMVTINVRVPGYAGKRLNRVDAEYSTDRGVNWDMATIRKVGSHWEIRLRTPVFGSISLRATAVIGDGHWVTQTVIGAYGVR